MFRLPKADIYPTTPYRSKGLQQLQGEVLRHISPPKPLTVLNANAGRCLKRLLNYPGPTNATYVEQHDQT
jgi:hypothetical protein